MHGHVLLRPYNTKDHLSSGDEAAFKSGGCRVSDSMRQQQWLLFEHQCLDISRTQIQSTLPLLHILQFTQCSVARENQA
jgi:hypothetical protein